MDSRFAKMAAYPQYTCCTGLSGPDGFVQGSPTSEPGRAADETQFTHILTRNLAVMETEVTRSMWNALKALQPNLINDPTDSSYGSGPDNPVQHVYWGYAAIFANLLSIQNGLVPCYYTDNTKNIVVGRDTTTAFPCYCDFNANGYRLPTEGEWEYFTRAGTTTPLSIAEKKSWNRTQPPDYFPAPNPWHLKHIYGNVWEWCWDRYGTYPTGTVTDYRGADTGNELIYRGGAFDVPTDGCRSARREKYYSRDQKIGFRLVRTL